VNRAASLTCSTSPAQHMNPVWQDAPAPLGEYSDHRTPGAQSSRTTATVALASLEIKCMEIVYKKYVIITAISIPQQADTDIALSALLDVICQY